MIVFDLMCSVEHRFEGWFRSSEDFGAQQRGGLLTCPQCGCSDVGKAPMAPAVPAKTNRSTVPSDAGKPRLATTSDEASHLSNRQTLPADFAAAFAKLAAAQSKALAKSKWVGDDFAERSRAIHYGEAADEPIHGRARGEEAAALIEEGIVVLPLLVPVVPPEEAN